MKDRRRRVEYATLNLNNYQRSYCYSAHRDSVDENKELCNYKKMFSYNKKTA